MKDNISQAEENRLHKLPTVSRSELNRLGYKVIEDGNGWRIVKIGVRS